MYNVAVNAAENDNQKERTNSMPVFNRLKIVPIVAGCAVLALSQTAQAQSTRTPWTNLTPEKMTAVWWQWAYSVPYLTSPWWDDTGNKAASGQPYFTAPGGPGELFFLAGTDEQEQLANGDTLGEVTRSLSVKAGTAFFFPLINAEWDDVYCKPRLGGFQWGKPMGVPVLLGLASGFVDSAGGLYTRVTPAGGATIDLGNSIVRLQSQPFPYKLPDGNVYQLGFHLNVPRGTVSPAISDGYWVFIPGDFLAPGTYLLEFGGSAPQSTGGSFIEKITYQITITP